MLRAKRAVSIIELLVVVVILLIFSTLTVISYHGMARGLAARSQSSEINAAFVLARELAITNSQPHQVVIDRPTRTFWIDRLDSTGSQIESPQVTGIEPFLPQALVEQVTINSAVIPETGRGSILFRPDGSSDRAVMHLAQRGADLTDDTEYFSIVLYPPTAQARIYPNERR